MQSAAAVQVPEDRHVVFQTAGAAVKVASLAVCLTALFVQGSQGRVGEGGPTAADGETTLPVSQQTSGVFTMGPKK